MKFDGRAPLRIDFLGGWDGLSATLTAAITRYAAGSHTVPPPGSVRPPQLAYHLELPAPLGLGAGAAETVLWVALTHTPAANRLGRMDIAEITCQIQQMVATMEARQDAYASALGGINVLRFGVGTPVERIDLNAAGRDLHGRLFIAYPGLPREGHERESAPATVLNRLSDLADEMKESLLVRNVEQFGALLNVAWQQQHALHPGNRGGTLDQLIAIGRANGALGATAAGNGPCAVFLAQIGRERELRRVLQAAGTVINADIDTYGVHIKKG